MRLHGKAETRQALPIRELRGEYGLYVVLHSNRCVALRDISGRPIHLEGTHELVVPGERKVPLWKQSMDMQMGRKPRATTQSSEIYRIREIIDPMQVERHRYTPYVCK